MELVTDQEDNEDDARKIFDTYGVTLVNGDSAEDIKKLEHQVVATLKLSGSIVKIAVDDSNIEPTIWLWIDDQPEVTYMSPCEVELLIASLKLAVHESTGKDT